MKRLISLFTFKAAGERFIMRDPNPSGNAGDYHCFGLLVNWRAQWVGAHYSPAHKRLCVNLLPGVTLWWTKPGGMLP